MDSTRFTKEQLPNLPQSIIDTANMCMVDYHKNRKSFDCVFAETVMQANDICLLELEKMKHVGEAVHHPGNRFVTCGFIPSGLKNPKSVIEKLLVERNGHRKNKDWKEADRIRDLLNNVTINDSEEGTTYFFDDLIHPRYSWI